MLLQTEHLNSGPKDKPGIGNHNKAPDRANDYLHSFKLGIGKLIGGPSGQQNHVHNESQESNHKLTDATLINAIAGPRTAVRADSFS